MKKIFIVLFLFFVFLSVTSAQTPKIVVHNPPIPIDYSPMWGNDLVISPTEPQGRMSGAYNISNNTIYLAVPDTNIYGTDMAVLKSTNNGANWAIHLTYTFMSSIRKVKVVNAGNDSIYCLFLAGTSLYCSNLMSFNFTSFTAYPAIRDFDATASSTHSLYLIINVNTNNDVRIYGTINGGTTWGGAIYLTSTGARPRIYMSGTGDTCLINYYGVTIQPDTISSQIRNVRYRESVPGTLTIVGSFTTPITSTVPKDQMQGVINNGKAWLFYTSGTTGNIDLNCMVSSDNGTTYGTPFTIGAVPSWDEYWFDAKHFLYGGGGVDLIYYADTLQSGNPTNQTDKLFYTSATTSSPGTFTTPFQISQHWPFWSNKMYIPSIIEYYDVIGDVGAVWVGGPAPYKLYFDRLSSVTRITNNNANNPGKYLLSQNYPNPFNPFTKINFSIPKNGIVSLRVYDILGKYILTLVNENLNSGNYTVDFNASNLSSGIYFYKLISGSFEETKKMTIVK